MRRKTTLYFWKKAESRVAFFFSWSARKSYQILNEFKVNSKVTRGKEGKKREKKAHGILAFAIDGNKYFMPLERENQQYSNSRKCPFSQISEKYVWQEITVRLYNCSTSRAVNQSFTVNLRCLFKQGPPTAICLYHYLMTWVREE